MSCIKSPLNYTGGKYRILGQIIPLFPDRIDTFVDLFGGGFNVGVNVSAGHTCYNDTVTPLCVLMAYLAEHKPEEVITALEANIAKHGLTKTDKEAFLRLREKYNTSDYADPDAKTLDFYTLILYSFNYQIRFNRNMEYNTPFGKDRSSFNSSVRHNLSLFVEKLNTMDLRITNLPFDEYDFTALTPHDFVYCDPPYLITTGSYNDGNRGIKDWTEDDERKLLGILDKLHGKGIRFALSEALRANGRENMILKEWSGKYNVNPIDNDFGNSNYHRRHKNDLTEVLITDY